MIQAAYDISKVNYMALPALTPGVLMFYRGSDTDSIIDCVINFTGVTIQQLKSKKRYRHFVEARMMAIWLIRKHTSLTLHSIGRMFGNRDHTTIIYSVQTVEDLIQTDEKFKQLLLLIENKLSS